MSRQALTSHCSKWQNRPNQHGLYFWQRTGQHIWYESALEAACLVALDDTISHHAGEERIACGSQLMS